jgi:chaperonin GroES
MIRPIRGNVLLKADTGESKTVSGIVLPGQDKPEAVVVALGDGNMLYDGTVVPFVVKVGDKVMFKAGAGSLLKEGGETFLIMPESEIIAVLE